MEGRRGSAARPDVGAITKPHMFLISPPSSVITSSICTPYCFFVFCFFNGQPGDVDLPLRVSGSVCLGCVSKTYAHWFPLYSWLVWPGVHLAWLTGMSQVMLFALQGDITWQIKKLIKEMHLLSLCHVLAVMMLQGGVCVCIQGEEHAMDALTPSSPK